MLTLHYIIIEVVVFFDYCYMIRYVQHYNYVQFSVECRKLFSLFFFFFRISTRSKWFKKESRILLDQFWLCVRYDWFYNTIENCSKTMQWHLKQLRGIRVV